MRFATIAIATGVRLHYVESGSPAGEPVLFLHGYTDSWFSFSSLIPFLPPAWRVLAIDQRGHGDSERPPSGYALAELAADAAAFLDAVGVRRAAVVGHSMGSFVAQRLAIAHPDRVARLVLIGSYTSAANDVVRGLQREVHALGDPVSEAFVREFQVGTVHQPLPAPFLERVVAESRKLPARLWQTLIDEIVATGSRDELGAIRAPTLILWGEHDAICGREEQDRLRQGIAGAVLTTYPDCGHSPHWEDPRRVAHDLIAFLGS